MEQVLSMIGLAKKAGRVEIGEEPVGAAARAKKARIILLASDAGPSSARRAASFATVGGCPLVPLGADKDAMGRCLGRTSVAMAAVTDVGFADAIVKKLTVLDPSLEQVSEQLAAAADRARERRQEQARHDRKLHRGANSGRSRKKQ